MLRASARTGRENLRSLNATADSDDIYWVSVYVKGWAVQEHPYYPDKAREPNHMDDRVNKLSVARNVFGLE
jgi:hypothetical protein